MRKKEAWMKKGARVVANGKPGTIKKMQENELDGVEYVYYIWVECDNGKKGNFHPNDVEPLKEEE